MRNQENIHVENDKWYCPFLLAASFGGLIKFEGSFFEDRVLYLKFFPKTKALELIDQFRTKSEPHIPAQDLAQAIETFWKKVADMRKGEIKDGKF